MIAPKFLLLALVTGAMAQIPNPIEAGIAALNKDDLAEAEASFERATRLEPENPKAWLLLAQTDARRKNRAQALEAARKAEMLGADDPAILQGLANFYATLVPDPAKSATLGERYAERAPADQTAWQRLAAFCLSTGQTEAAIRAAKRALQLNNNAGLHSLLGNAYLQRKESAKAAVELAEAVKLSPYDEDAHFRLAQAYLLQPDFVSAARVLENARKVFDKSPQIELALGVAYYGLREFSKAVDQFLTTIRLAPGVSQPYVFLGRILDQTGERLPLVTQRFAQFEASHPNEPMGYVLHAKAIVAGLPTSGNSPDAAAALELIRKALALQENNAEAHYLAGVLMERKGDWNNAVLHLEQSIASNARDPAPHYRLARVYARLGRKADSERERALHEKLSEEEMTSDARGALIERPPAPSVVR